MNKGKGRMHDIFGPGSNMGVRVVEDYEEIGRRVRACRDLGLRIVLTSGTFDLVHEGQLRYLEKAKEHGDILIVGVDNDEKVRYRKGQNRPIVSERERMEVICHSRHVDLVFLKKLGDPRWQLIKTIRPDVLIATEETYNEEQLRQLEEFCREVVVLPRQAAKSTTARIRHVLLTPSKEIKKRLQEAGQEIQLRLEEVISFLDRFAGGV